MKGTLFAKLYNSSEETIKAAKKPFQRKAMKRKIKAAYDDALEKIETNNENIQKEYLKFKEFDVNACLELKQENKTLEEEKEGLKEMYKELFDQELNPDIE